RTDQTSSPSSLSSRIEPDALLSALLCHERFAACSAPASSTASQPPQLPIPAARFAAAAHPGCVDAVQGWNQAGTHPSQSLVPGGLQSVWLPVSNRICRRPGGGAAQSYYFWLPLRGMAPVSGKRGAPPPEPVSTAPFGRAPGEAAGGAGARALPKRALIVVVILQKYPLSTAD
ncbi:unnamed protein product, partial [Urochloa humidicola]